MMNYHLPEPDAWKRRDNSILLDVRTWDFKIHNRTRGKIRLYLGHFQDGDFLITIPTIQTVSPEHDLAIRTIAQSIVYDLNQTSDTRRRKRLSR
jgi:hypothetical protein